MLLAGPACAQVSGSLALVSDYRYRGASLSAGAPSALLALAWDGADGGYAGVQLARVHPGGDYGVGVQALPYAGLVRRLRNGLAAEAGVQYSWFSTDADGYAEAYAGLGGEHLRGRVFYAPRYFDAGHAWYVEAEGDRPLGRHWRALFHAGALRVRTGARYPGPDDRGWRGDVALGLALRAGGLDWQASWIATTGGKAIEAYCNPWECGSGDGWVLRVARAW